MKSLLRSRAASSCAILVALCATALLVVSNATGEEGDGLVRGTLSESDARPVFPKVRACASILVAVDHAFFGPPKEQAVSPPEIKSDLVLKEVEAGYSASEWLLDGVLLPTLDEAEVQTCQIALDDIKDEDDVGVRQFGLTTRSEDSSLLSLLKNKTRWRFDSSSHTIWYSLGPPNRPWPLSDLIDTEGVGQKQGFALPADSIVALAADTAEIKNMINRLVDQPIAEFNTWPYLLGAVILSAVFTIFLALFWLQARNDRMLLLRLLKSGEVREHDLEQRATAEVNRIAAYLVQETRALADSVRALDYSLRGGERDEHPILDPDEEPAGEAAAVRGAEPAEFHSSQERELASAKPAQPTSGLIAQSWQHRSAQWSGTYDVEALVQRYNSWLNSDRDMRDFPVEMGLVEANGVRHRDAEPYGAILLPDGARSGISLFILALGPEDAIGLPGADIVVGSFRSAALQARSKPFFDVDIGKSARLKVVRPCVFRQQDEALCVLIEPGILVAPQ